jgi:uncharacterized protein (TIGR02271 family)
MSNYTQSPGTGTDYTSWLGQTVLDSKGDKVGKIAQVYLDDQSGQPAWLTIKTGLFGTRSSFVPLQGAEPGGNGVTVAYDKDTIQGAPHIEDDGVLSPEEEQELYSYYEQDYSSNAGSGGYTTAGPGGYTSDASMTAGQTTAGMATGTQDAMTRSEERLTVGKAREEVGRARLRKYVVTENVQTTVPVSHEEVRLEREPITSENYQQAVSGPEISEAEHEVVLTAERPVVQKEVVPVERVRLATETVTEEAAVQESVRKEQIASEGIEDTPRRS